MELPDLRCHVLCPRWSWCFIDLADEAPNLRLAEERLLALQRLRVQDASAPTGGIASCS